MLNFSPNRYTNCPDIYPRKKNTTFTIRRCLNREKKITKPWRKLPNNAIQCINRRSRTHRRHQVIIFMTCLMTLWTAHVLNDRTSFSEVFLYFILSEVNIFIFLLQNYMTNERLWLMALRNRYDLTSLVNWIRTVSNVTRPQRTDVQAHEVRLCKWLQRLF